MCGEIDLFTTDFFMEALQDACTTAHQEADQQGIQNILVDLRQIRFLDSAGLAALVVVRRDLKPACTMTLVIKPKTQPERVIRMSGFDSFFPILDSLPAFDPPQA